MTDQTPDPIDVEWTYWKHRSDGWSVDVVDDSGIVCIVPAASRDDLDAFATASRIATLLTRPDDATRKEVERLVADQIRAAAVAAVHDSPDLSPEDRESLQRIISFHSRTAELLDAAYLGEVG